MNSFYRKVAFGIGPVEKNPKDQLEWALNQLNTIPPLQWKGTIPKEKTLRKKLESFTLETRKLRKKFKNNNKGFKEARKIAAFNSGHHYWEPLEYSIRHDQTLNSPSPVLERFWLFWANHFAISKKNSLQNYSTGAYTRETIRANLTGSFEHMLSKVTLSWTMLRHLDNKDSVGPDSDRGKKIHKKRKSSSINENHARELLELHTISPASGFTQQDVIQLTYIMTGWGFKPNKQKLPTGDVFFDQNKHQPGRKKVLGRYYREGKNAIFQVMKDLSNHPDCRKNIATKLCKHFISDRPTQDMIQPIVQAWEKSKGSLIEIHKATIRVAYQYAKIKKLQNPEVWLLQIAKMTDMNWPTSYQQMSHYTFDEKTKLKNILHNKNIMKELGHLPFSPSQPNGWPETESDWMSPELMARRLVYAQYVWSLIKENNKNEIFYKNLVYKNFDQPDRLWKILHRQSSLMNLHTMLFNTPEVLKI